MTEAAILMEVRLWQPLKQLKGKAFIDAGIVMEPNLVHKQKQLLPK